MTATYKAYAIRYGSARDRLSEQNFMFPPARGLRMALDYYFWVLQGEGRVILIDAAFSQAVGQRRGRPVDAELPDLLAAGGIAPQDVTDVILSHLHFDHTGFVASFPKAQFHVQKAEWASALVGLAEHRAVQWTYEAADLQFLLGAAFAGRLNLLEGDCELLPGITLYLLPGHAAGQTAVRVQTERGPVMIAVDVTHFYANLLLDSPFIVTEDSRETLRSYARLRRLEPEIDRIIPGHDPKVRVLYPAEFKGNAAWHPLHQAPRSYPEGWLTCLSDYPCD